MSYGYYYCYFYLKHINLFHFSQREVSQHYLDQKNFSAWSSYKRSLTSVMMRLLMKTSGLGWYISETVKSQNLKTIKWFRSWTETFPGIHLRYLFVLFKDLETVHETVFDLLSIIWFYMFLDNGECYCTSQSARCEK